MENTGNAYRTRQALVGAFILIAAALAIVIYGATDLGALAAAGIFILVVGIGIAALSLMFSGTPDKFGPSERVYRLVAGVLLAIIGAVLLLHGFGAAWYILIAVLLIGIAILGALTAISNSKQAKY
ncbi:transmembrane protein [methanogenic archaeon ISO4-H5]|jgi:hypothetical protein|nr:transmembrane protein [methanogenic archaeon ISO4-H5]